MSPEEIQNLIAQKQQAIQAIDKEIQTAQGRSDSELATSLEGQKQPHIAEMNRLQSQVLPKAQKEQADKVAKEAAEQARKEQEKKDNSSTGGLFG